MKKYILFLALSSIPLQLQAVSPKFLIKIINEWQGPATIKSTDPHSGTILYKGTQHTNKQDEFSVEHISAINYVIPHEFTGAIIITSYNTQGVKIASAALKEKGATAYNYENGRYVPSVTHERSGYLVLEKLTGNVAQGTFSINPTAVVDDKPALNTIAIKIDKHGGISIAKLLTISLLNSTGAPLEVGSPDCSGETIDKIFGRISNDPTQRYTFTLPFSPSNCKLVATTVGASTKNVPVGSQTTACITDKWDLSDQCKNCALDESGDYICCHADPFTGENVCQSEGIAWVRGKIFQNQGHVLIDYGIAPRKK